MILPRRKPADLAALGGLAVLALLALRPATLGGGAFYDRDIHLVWHPQVETFVRALASGSWPVWDAYTGFGQTLWGNPTCVPVLYPPTWAHLLMRPWVYYTVFSTGHLLFSGVGLFRLARHLGLSRGAAFTGAGLWMASGPLLSLLNVWNHFLGASWIPWVVLAGSRAWQTGEARRWLLWGAGFGVQVLAGSPDMAVVAALGSVAVAARNPPALSLGEAGRRALLGGSLAAGAALALSAGQWLPTLEAIGRSARATLPAEANVFWSVPPWLLLQALVPVLPQDLPLQPRWASSLFGGRAPFLASLYLGTPALGLVTASFAGGGRRVGKLALWGLFLLSLAGAVGSDTPVYRLLVNLLPPLRWVRYPAKLCAGAALAWALLAAQGFDAWRRREPPGVRVSVVGAFVLLGTMLSGVLLLGLSWGRVDAFFLTTGLSNQASLPEALAPATRSLEVTTLSGGAALMACLAACAWVRARAAVPWTLAALAVGELVWFHGTLNPVVPAEFYRAQPPVVGFLQPPRDARVYSYEYFFIPGRSERYLGRANPYLLPRSPRASPARAAEAVALRSYLYPPVGAVWGLRGSYDGDVLDLASPAVTSLTDALHQAEETPGHLRLLQLAGVDRLIALHGRGFESLQRLAVLPSRFPEPIQLFAVPDPLPRTYAVGGARPARDEDAARLLLQTTFDPRGEIVVPADQAARGPAGSAGTSRVVAWRADRVVLEADLERPGYVVLLEGYDPGWRGTIDGRDAPVVQANLAFRAVAAEAGHHRIEFRYRPLSVRAGLAVTLASLLGGLLALARPRRPAAAGASSD